MSKKYELTAEEKAMLERLLSDVQSVSIKKHAPVKKPATQKKILTTYHRPLTTILDLHGLTLVIAHGQLAAFITEHYQQKTKKIMVIMGKSGELARDVPRWLTLGPLAGMVAGVAYAEQGRGGTGALVVKLKKHDR